MIRLSIYIDIIVNNPLQMPKSKSWKRAESTEKQKNILRS